MVKAEPRVRNRGRVLHFIQRNGDGRAVAHDCSSTISSITLAFAKAVATKAAENALARGSESVAGDADVRAAMSYLVERYTDDSVNDMHGAVFKSKDSK